VQLQSPTPPLHPKIPHQYNTHSYPCEASRKSSRLLKRVRRSRSRVERKQRPPRLRPKWGLRGRTRLLPPTTTTVEMAVTKLPLRTTEVPSRQRRRPKETTTLRSLLTRTSRAPIVRSAFPRPSQERTHLLVVVVVGSQVAAEEDAQKEDGVVRALAIRDFCGQVLCPCSSLCSFFLLYSSLVFSPCQGIAEHGYDVCY